MRSARSGQFVFFTLNSVLSGFPVTGMSGSISGRKSIDGLSGMIVLSGNIIELGGGSYRANLYDWDCSGLQAGYLFTCSGCVSVQYQFDMIDGNGSGAVWPASGVNVTVPISSISGNISNSGLTVTVIKSLLSGVVANSGLTTTVLPETISGVFSTVLPANLSGVVANSGLNVEANVVRWLTKPPKPLVASGHVDAFPSLLAGTVVSGTASTIQLNGAPTGTSGIFDGAIISLVEGLAKGQSRVIKNFGSSGIALIDPPWEVVPETTEFYIITPTTRTASGVTFPSLPKAALSGVVANSGIFAAVPIATLSGVVANSGIFAAVPPATLSGVNVIADVARWKTVVPNDLIASGRLDAAFNLRTNVARSGTSTTIQLDASAPLGTSGIFDGDLITIIGGSGANETRKIAFYNSSGNVTVDKPWAVAAFADSIFTITPNTNIQSGTTFIASGPFVVANATVDPALISGLFVTVPKATISGVIANSGLFVTATATVDPASISGAFVTVPIATISGVIANSGLFVTVPKATISGVVANSGLFVTATASVDPASISGAFVTVPIATISGLTANSGLTVTVIKSLLSGVVSNSGLFTTVLPANLSGVVANSGLVTQAQLMDGVVHGGTTASLRLGGTTSTPPFFVTNSGGDAVQFTAQGANGDGCQILGHGAGAGLRVAQDTGGISLVAGDVAVANTFSMATLSVTGTTALTGAVTATNAGNDIRGVSANSGVFATVPKESLSGVVANSGLFVSVLPVNLSGTFVTVPKATLSGVWANSGLFVNAAVVATVASGELYLASGSIFLNTFSSGTLNEAAFKVLTRNVSGREAELPYQSLGATTLKLTSRFNAPSGTTYMADGTTVFMEQAVTTSSSAVAIIELGVAEAP